MTAKYTSLLVCFHPNHSDLYINGVPLAIVKGGAVELNKVNPLIFPESNFKNVADLKLALCEVLDMVKDEINLQNLNGNKF